MPSNFKNDLTPGVLESGPMALADSSAIKAKECTSVKFDGQYTLFKLDIIHDLNVRVFEPYRMILIIVEAPKVN